MSEYLTMLTAAEAKAQYGIELADLPFGDIPDELLIPRRRNGRKAKPVETASTPAVATLARHFDRPATIETPDRNPEAATAATEAATVAMVKSIRKPRKANPEAVQASTAVDAVVNRKALHAAVNLAAAFAFRRSPRATETGLLIVADGSTLTLCVRSCERTAAVRVDTIACGTFTAVASPKSLRSILTQLGKAKAQAVRLTAGDDHVLTIQANGSETRLTAAHESLVTTPGKPATVQPTEFPAAIDCEPFVRFSISVDALDTAISQTQFATDAESTRYALGGILIGCNDKAQSVTFAATDSRRLAVHHATLTTYAALSAGLPPQWTPVVPWEICYGVRKLCDASQGAVTVELGAHTCRFAGDGWTVSTRMIEGRFPKYQDVIPRDFSFRSECNAAELLSACRGAMAVRNDESRGVDFDFCSDESGKLIISAKSAIGKARETVQQKPGFGGCGLQPVTMDAKQIADWLEVQSASESVEWFVIDHESAVRLQSSRSTYLVMPFGRTP